MNTLPFFLFGKLCVLRKLLYKADDMMLFEQFQIDKILNIFNISAQI